MKKIVTLCITVLTAVALNGQKQYLIAGTYTDNSHSQGIYVYDFNQLTGKAALVGQQKSENPSYLAISKDGKYVYSVNESGAGGVSSYSFDRGTGALTFINKVSSMGSSPCYIELDHSGKWLFCGNYSSGNLSLYPVNGDGSIGAVKQVVQHEGAGPDKDRQEAPHVHSTVLSPDNRFLYVPDLGIDKVMIYPFNAADGSLFIDKRTFASVAPGGGPRHIIFSKSGKFAYLVEEMSGKVDLFSCKNGQLSLVQTMDKLPVGEAGAGADIHLSPDEKFLYVSQRSNSTLQIYSVQRKKGTLSYKGSYPTLGNFPRNFTIHPSGKFVLVANQRSGDITIFKRNKQTGLLADTGQKIQLDKPVCLKWAP